MVEVDKTQPPHTDDLADDEARLVTLLEFEADSRDIPSWRKQFQPPVTPKAALVRVAAYTSVINIVRVTFSDGQIHSLTRRGYRRWLADHQPQHRGPVAGELALLRETGVRALVEVKSVNVRDEMREYSLQVLDDPPPFGNCAPSPGPVMVSKRVGCEDVGGIWQMDLLMTLDD